jgi:hypothetical protein
MSSLQLLQLFLRFEAGGFGCLGLFLESFQFPASDVDFGRLLVDLRLPWL